MMEDWLYPVEAVEHLHALSLHHMLPYLARRATGQSARGTFTGSGTSAFIECKGVGRAVSEQWHAQMRTVYSPDFCSAGTWSKYWLPTAFQLSE